MSVAAMRVRMAKKSGFPITDSFNRTDSSTTLGSTDGGTILAWTPLTGTWGINTNRAYCATSGSGDQDTAVVESGVADATVQVTVTVAGDGGICFRATDTNNYFVIGNDPPTSKLYKRVAGTFTAIATGGTQFVNGDVMKITFSGTSITVYLNGTSVLTATSTHNQTATKHGLRLYGATSTSMRFDNFSIAVP